MSKVPLGISQLTDNVVIGQSEPDFLLGHEALFSEGKQIIILPVSFGSWYSFAKLSSTRLATKRLASKIRSPQLTRNL